MPTETMNATPTSPVRYHGRFDPTLDDKRRMQVPAKWRPESGEMQWMALLWPKGGVQGVFLNVLTADKYDRVMSKLVDSSLRDEKAASVLRYFSRNSGELSLDKQGRVMIPENLAQGAGIFKQAILVGMVDHWEIWSPERYQPTAAQEDAVVSAELGNYL